MGLVLPAGPGGVHTPDVPLPNCYIAACATAPLCVGGAGVASQGEEHTRGCGVDEWVGQTSAYGNP